MKIYRLREDVNKYQSVYVDESKWKGDLLDALTFDCRPKASSWSAPSVFILHPKLERGNFLHLAPGALVMDESTTEELRDLLEMSGELLPIDCVGEKFWISNVTECINVLDEDKTEWLYDKGDGPIKRYAFHP